MTAEGLVRLRKDVLVEPLIRQWYAWPYLIAPHSASMWVANSHVRLMESFCSSPDVHEAALKNAAMRGGPFMELPASATDRVAELLARTREQAKEQLALASAIAELEGVLAGSNGASLEPCYAAVPAALRGKVELVYDLAHRPRVRYIEPLLYRSPAYAESAQSICLSHRGDAARGFAFSTPRLLSANHLDVAMPFRARELDVLYRARTWPVAPETIRAALGGRDFTPFFEPAEASAERPRHDGPPRIRYFGHASVLVETSSTSILFDPSPLHGDDAGLDRFRSEDLPEKIDYVVLTHNHQDHVMIEPLLELRHRIGTVVIPGGSGGALEDPSLSRILHALGFSDVRSLEELEGLAIPDGELVALPFLGEHGDLCVRAKAGFLLRASGVKMLFLVDSNNLEPKLYEHIAAVVGTVDVMLIGMECEGGPMSFLYGPLFTKPVLRKHDQTRRLDGSDFEKAKDLVDRFAPRHVYVYAMGQEPWLRHVMAVAYTAASKAIVESDRLVSYCKGLGLEAERLYLKKEIALAR